eukprot:scaffold7529_cov35-Prasinocladus_malaysianus.AAC.1
MSRKRKNQAPIEYDTRHDQVWHLAQCCCCLGANPAFHVALVATPHRVVALSCPGDFFAVCTAIDALYPFHTIRDCFIQVGTFNIQ